MSGSGEGFLSRWSRRKRATTLPPSAAPPADAAPLPEAEVEAFDVASLPSIESLTAETDITPFLRPQVPAALRRAALRRVWTLDTAIRDYVGPADYAWDFNAPDGMAGFSLELGGDVKRLLAQAIGLTDPAEEKAPPAPAPELVMAEADATLPEPEAMALPAPDAPGEMPVAIVEAPPDPVAVPPRRHGGARPA